MKVGFLFYANQWTSSLEQIVQAFTAEGHYVFLMINDAKQRRLVADKFADNPHIHIEQLLDGVSVGDLSLAKYYLLMMRSGLENPEIKYFITLGEPLAPLKTNQYLEQFLDEYYPANFCKIFEQTIDSKYFDRYYPYTNLKSFGSSKLIQNWSKMTANLLVFLRIKRKPIEGMVVGSSSFMVSDQGAKQLVAHMEYLLDNFKLSWFPEQIALPTMLKKFTTQKHINNNYILTNQIKPFAEVTPIAFSEKDLMAQQLFGGPYDQNVVQRLLKHYHQKNTV